MPVADVVARYERIVPGAPADVYDRVLALTFQQSFLVRTLLMLRGLQLVPVAEFTATAFTTLDEARGESIVWGMIAQPWRWSGGVRRVTPAEFAAFNERGFARITWDFTFSPVATATHVATETRVLCTDAISRARFKVYWALVGPFSGLIRHEMLRLLARQV